MSIAVEPVAARDAALRTKLTALWKTPDNWLARLCTVDHKALGKRYIYTGFLFFFLGGIEALVIRVQLARPENALVTPEQYNQLMSMHGITMMFLFILPVLSGFSFYLTPLMIGARELAFPRLNAFSYFGFLLAGLFISSSFAIGQSPNDGWFNYAPLSDIAFNPGLNIDFYTLGLIFLGISTTAGACNSIVTILKLRAPGMSIARMPLFLWSSLTISVSIVFSMPALTAALGLLELERHWQFVFFNATRGGDPMLWQHLFWVFGHPWVYIIFLPATGMLSMIVPTFSRRPMIGHEFVALSTVITGLVGFGVWVHHMFSTGMSQLSMTFFAAASMTVSVPSAVTIFAWLATMWYGRVILATPMLFAIAFIVQFTIGGISGVMTAAVPFDWQVTDTYFIVAHIHYVLAGGSVFGVFAAIYYWAPKMYGWMLDEVTGKVSFWLMFIGFNVGFFPMHVSGLLGMPRRIYTYPEAMGVTGPNLLSTVGVYVFAVGIAVTAWNLLYSRNRVAAGPNPWHAGTLEWLAESPPEHFNFARIPTVSSPVPLWDDGYVDGPAYEDGRLTPVTSALDASLQRPVLLPTENFSSVLIAFTMLAAFAALLVRSYLWTAVGSAVTLAVAARWVWPATRSSRAER